MAKATVSELKKYFESDGGRKVTLLELKELKASNNGSDYDAIANGIGDASLTY
jgi:hypothetical protein